MVSEISLERKQEQNKSTKLLSIFPAKPPLFRNSNTLQGYCAYNSTTIMIEILMACFPSIFLVDSFFPSNFFRRDNHFFRSTLQVFSELILFFGH